MTRIYSSKLPIVFAIIMIIAICFSTLSCNDDEEREAKFQAQVEKQREVLANHCNQDSDCIVTGCRQTMCRAMPEPDYCEHRIVLAIEDKDDITAVKNIVSDQLTVREAESIRIGGYSADKWTLSFHASQIQRQRIETSLEHLSLSGFALLHPHADLHTNALYEQLKNDKDISLKSMRGAGKLVEKQIRSGDVLSKDDIRSTWEQIAPAIKNVHVSEDDEIERLWSYDVIFDKVSTLRLWPIDKRQRISAKQWHDFEERIDNGDIIITGTLAAPVVDTFRRWTEQGKLIAILVGNEVIATAIPDRTIEDGRFELVIKDGAKSDPLVDSIETLKAIARMKGYMHYDKAATQNVERDLSCHTKYPRECGCVEGSCGWKLNVDYNKCLFE